MKTAYKQLNLKNIKLTIYTKNKIDLTSLKEDRNKS